MSQNKNSYRKGKISIKEIFRVIKQRKVIVFAVILIALLITFLFNIFKKPLYESSVLFKKEILYGQTDTDMIRTILSDRSQDELETEMQLIKTRHILNTVIEKLSLNLIVEQVIEQDGTVTTIDLPLTEYQHKYELNEYPKTFPKINQLDIGLCTHKGEFTVLEKKNNTFDILNKFKVSVFNYDQKYSELPPSKWKINIGWPENSAGSKIRIESLNYNDVLDDLLKNTSTEKKIKTNIFELFVKSNYPYTTKLIADKLANAYRQSRLDIHNENIKNSFDFIDKRLKDVSHNLENAESDLSYFKSKEKIIQIDEQSKQLIDFLSNLESEKLKTELELGTYKNKIRNISKEMDSEGYVDQTYLTPEKYASFDSPFFNLLKQLNEAELQRLELLQKRTESHPDAILKDEQIERIKKELAKYNQNTLTAFKIIQSSLKNKLENISSLIKKYSVELEKLPEQESKLARLIRQKEAFEKMYTTLLEKREEMRVAELAKLQDIIILDKAIEPVKPISPNKTLNLLLAGIFGMLLGIIGAIVFHFNDKKISNIYDIERDFNFSILSVIPPYEKNIKKTITTTNKVGNRFVCMMEDNLRYKEAFRTLETKLSAKIEGSTKKVMFTSCEEDAGKTSVSANLAITIAQSDKKVILIDCDIKNPSVAELFGLPKFSSGLIDYLTEKTETPNIYKPIKLTDNPNLLMNIDILPTGAYSNISGEILASERMNKLLINLGYYDFVILDTPPITRVSDALSLGRIVKDTVLVIRTGQTEKESISWAVSELQSTDMEFLGTLVNDCEVKDSSLKYQYGYNYQNS